MSETKVAPEQEVTSQDLASESESPAAADPVSGASSPTVSPQAERAPEASLPYDEFLDWIGENPRVEWVDGEIQIMSPVSSGHQNLVDFLTTILRHFVEERGAGWVRSSGMQVKMEMRPSGRVPDVVYLKTDEMERAEGTFVDGKANLVVEVISPESISRDRGEKYVEYEAAGIEEYWLVDPLRDELSVFRLNDEGRYRTVFQGKTGRADSEVVDGFWIKAEWLWDDTMPTIIEVLRTWELV